MIVVWNWEKSLVCYAMKQLSQSQLQSPNSNRAEPKVNKVPRCFSTGWLLWTGLAEIARLIHYADYLGLAKTDSVKHFYFGLLEKADEYTHKLSVLAQQKTKKNGESVVLKGNSIPTRWQKVFPQEKLLSSICLQSLPSHQLKSACNNVLFDF